MALYFGEWPPQLVVVPLSPTRNMTIGCDMYTHTLDIKPASGTNLSIINFEDKIAM